MSTTHYFVIGVVIIASAVLTTWIWSSRPPHTKITTVEELDEVHHYHITFISVMCAGFPLIALFAYFFNLFPLMLLVFFFALMGGGWFFLYAKLTSAYHKDRVRLEPQHEFPTEPPRPTPNEVEAKIDELLKQNKR